MLPDTTIKQGVAAEIELPANTSKNDTVYVRPVFHYAGYTIPYQEISAAQGPCVMPITTFIRKNGISVVAGAPIIGQKTADSTTLHIGNYLPVPAIDTFFVKGNPYASTITVIPNPETIVGTWKGRLDSVSTMITFNEDGTGVLKQGTEQKAFSYLLNTQTNGQIVLSFTDQTTRVFTLKSISALYLTVIDEQTGNKVKFTRQNTL